MTALREKTSIVDLVLKGLFLCQCSVSLVLPILDWKQFTGHGHILQLTLLVWAVFQMAVAGVALFAFPHRQWSSISNDRRLHLVVFLVSLCSTSFQGYLSFQYIWFLRGLHNNILPHLTLYAIYLAVVCLQFLLHLHVCCSPNKMTKDNEIGNDEIKMFPIMGPYTPVLQTNDVPR